MSEYVIPASRQKYIAENFFQWSFGKGDDFFPEKEVFLGLSHPAELHFLAHIYNWDDGSLVLEWILDSPLCSRSTANLLFWRSAPDWYLKFDIDDLGSCPPYNQDGFRVIQKVVSKYLNNDFSDYQIEFDPGNEIEEITSVNPKWEIPRGVFEKIDGVAIMLEDL